MPRTLEVKFGRLVRDRRTRLGISQEELAHRAGLHRTYISLLERGQRNPSLSVLVALARALKTHLSDLVETLDGGSARGAQ